MKRALLMLALGPTLAVAASAQTWVALLKTVPGVPGSVAEAARRYQARGADPGAPQVDEQWRDPKAAKFNDELLQRAQAASGSGAPGMPNAANAQALQNMSQQQQMAYAMQMVQQMNSPSAAPMTELTAADQKLIAQYTQRSEQQSSEYQAATDHAGQVSAKVEAWGLEHAQLQEQYQSRVDALNYCTQAAAIKKLVEDHRGAQRSLAEKHLAQATPLMQPRDRAVTEIAGFLDTHRPRAAAGKDPRLTGPVNSYTQHAVQVLGVWFGSVEQLHRYGATWSQPWDIQSAGGAC